MASRRAILVVPLVFFGLILLSIPAGATVVAPVGSAEVIIPDDPVEGVIINHSAGVWLEFTYYRFCYTTVDEEEICSDAVPGNSVKINDTYFQNVLGVGDTLVLNPSSKILKELITIPFLVIGEVKISYTLATNGDLVLVGDDLLIRDPSGGATVFKIYQLNLTDNPDPPYPPITGWGDYSVEGNILSGTFYTTEYIGGTNMFIDPTLEVYVVPTTLPHEGGGIPGTIVGYPHTQATTTTVAGAPPSGESGGGDTFGLRLLVIGAFAVSALAIWLVGGKKRKRRRG